MFPFVIVGFVGTLLGYATYYRSLFRWQSKDVLTNIEGPAYKIQIKPNLLDNLVANSAQGISITVENKTDQDLEIDWARTLYTFNGATDGGFIFDGKSIATQIHSKRDPDVVFPKQSLTRIVKPSALIKEQFHLPINPVGLGGLGRFGSYSPPPPTWTISPLKAGRHGVYMTLRQNGQTCTESLAFELEENQVKPNVMS